ncbi:hypothetical protein ACFL2Q_15525 [Thermodesulfobacteriota bacterium]
MQASVSLAAILGPYLIIASVGLLLNVKNYQRMAEEFGKSPALRYLAGFLALMFGLVVVHFHNVWKLDWTLFITVLGWLGIVKGTILIVGPGVLSKLSDTYARNSLLLRVNSVLVLALGILLTVKGYWV